MTCLGLAMYKNSKMQNNVNLTTLDEMLGNAQHDVMGEINQQWFKERLRELHISQRQLAKRVGMDPASMSYMLSGKRSMSMEEAKAIAGHLLVPVTEVMRQAGIEVLDDVRKVPVAGYIGEGGTIALLPNGTHDYAHAPANTPDGSYALQVRMVTSPRDGWLVFVSGVQLDPAQCLDKLCVVAMNDGGMMAAVIRRGYKLGLYNLIRIYENTPNVLENKEVTWASRILWIQPT